MIEIKRQNVGKNPTKYGIVLKLLSPRYRKILKSNPVIKKYSTDDRFIRAIFRIEDLHTNISYLKRASVHPETKEISTFSNIKTSYKYFNWNCAYCNSDISSKLGDMKPSNYTCKKCFDYYIKDNRKYDKRIIESSLLFTEKCKQLMIDNQNQFLKYIKRNEKPSKLL
jgi:hypothetical protein